jgi:hypothetical protein
LVIYVIQHNTYKIANLKYRYTLLSVWILKNHCQHTNEKYHFVLSLMWAEKTHSWIHKCAISFFSSPMWLVKLTCRPTNIQYYFWDIIGTYLGLFW